MKRIQSIRMVCCLILVIFSLQSLLPSIMTAEAFSSSEKKETLWKQTKPMNIKSPKTDRRNGNGERNRNSRSIRYREW